ncbi:hypothetical protein Aduo_003394 [Ancylostoma duodenale]
MSEFSTISRDSPMPLSSPQVNVGGAKHQMSGIWKERGVEGKEGCDQCEVLIAQLNNQAVISSRYERMWSEAIAKCFKEGKAMEAMEEKLDRVEKTVDRKEKLYRQDVTWQGLWVAAMEELRMDDANAPGFERANEKRTSCKHDGDAAESSRTSFEGIQSLNLTPSSVADSWTVVCEDDDVRHSDTRVTMEYLERISNLQRSLQLVDIEYKDSQKKVKVLTDLVQELKREKVILGLLTRADVGHSTIEVQPDGRLRLVVFDNDSSRVKECLMRKFAWRIRSYRRWSGESAGIMEGR